jgi:hypothetical protein
MAFAVAEPHWFPSVGWRKRAGFYIRPFLSRPLSAAAGSRVHTPAGVNRITSARVDKITTGIVHLAILALFLFGSFFFFFLIHNVTSLAWEAEELPSYSTLGTPGLTEGLFNLRSEILSRNHGAGPSVSRSVEQSPPVVLCFMISIIFGRRNRRVTLLLSCPFYRRPPGLEEELSMQGLLSTLIPRYDVVFFV